MIENIQGIHCRPSAVIVKEALNYDGEITVKGEAGECDLRSVMGLLSLGLQRGSSLTIRVTGPDDATVCERLVKLFTTQFDFPPRDQESMDMV